jgi:hypothetical protein
MKHIAPTDVTAPPDGWGWAMKDLHSCRKSTGEMKYVVRQKTSNGDRSAGPMSAALANALMLQWNNEAKAAA